MDYLYDRNRWVATQTGTPTGSEPPALRGLTAEDKHVVVIGGGDTGADCVGNSLREGATSITQLELLPEPPPKRPDDRTPWPLWPQKYRLSYAMEEAKTAGLGEQDFSIVTTHFAGDDDGHVRSLHYAQAERQAPFKPVPGTEGEFKADLVLLAMGFLHPEQDLLDKLHVAKDARGNAKAITPYTTSVEGVFAAGDARRGQSLIVWAINEGRQCARMVDRYLGTLPRRAEAPTRRRRRARGPAAARLARRPGVARPRARGTVRRMDFSTVIIVAGPQSASSSARSPASRCPGRDPMSIPMTIGIGLAGSFSAASSAARCSATAAARCCCRSSARRAIVYFVRRSRGGGLTDPGIVDWSQTVRPDRAPITAWRRPGHSMWQSDLRSCVLGSRPHPPGFWSTFMDTH